MSWIQSFICWHRTALGATYPEFRHGLDRYIATFWRKDGTWLRTAWPTQSMGEVATTRSASPSEAVWIVKSVKSAAMVKATLGIWWETGIKGRKRFLRVDTFRTHPAGLCYGSSEGTWRGKQVLQQFAGWGNAVSRLCIPFESMVGLMVNPFILQWWSRLLDCPKSCCDQNRPKGFVLLKKRWIGWERTFGWLMGCRRPSGDYERLPETLIYRSSVTLSRKKIK